MDLQRIEILRVGAALLAALITAGGALYGVYVKARQDAAAGYELLAPEVNRLKDTVSALERETEELRAALDEREGARPRPTQGRAPERHPRPPTTPPATPPPEAAPRTVPIDFDKALEVWKEIEKLRKKGEAPDALEAP